MTLPALLAIVAIMGHETRPARQLSREAAEWRGQPTKNTKALRIARKRKRHHNKHCGSGR